MMNDLPTLIERGKKLNKQYNQPTLDELRTINSIIIKFIREKQLIVYGGTSIDVLLKQKGNRIYDEDKVPDYDVLTPDNYNHSIELANILHKAGFPYINRTIALHEYSFKIFVNLSPEANCDLSYVPPAIFPYIPYIEIEGIRYIHPNYQMIDFYKSFIDMNNVYRWKDKNEYMRYRKLQTAYPIKPLTGPPPTRSVPATFFSYIAKIQERGPAPIFTGIHTYNRLMEYMGAPTIPLSFIEIYHADIDAVAKGLSAKFPQFLAEKRYPLLDHLSYSFVIRDQQRNIVATINNSNDIYIPNLAVINIGAERHTSYHNLLLFLHISINKFNIIGAEEEAKLTQNMIVALIKTREEYLNRNKMIGIDVGKETGSPLNIFNMDVREIPMSFREKMLLRRKYERLPSMSYNPAKKIIEEHIDYKYTMIDYSVIPVQNLNTNANKKEECRRQNIKTGVCIRREKSSNLNVQVQAQTGGSNSAEIREQYIIRYIGGLSDLITKLATKRYESVYDSTYRPIIEEFIKTNKLIVINEMIFRLLDPKHEIREKDYYYEVYGNQQIKDLTKALMDERISKIIGINSVELSQVDNYRFNLVVNFKPILTIIKLRDDVFNNMPKIVLNNGITILHPNMIRLNIYRTLTNPRQDIDNWEKTLRIEQLMDKVYPMRVAKDRSGGGANRDQLSGVVPVVMKWALEKQDIIIVGDLGANMILGNQGAISKITILCNDPTKLLEILMRDGMTVRIDRSYLSLFDKRWRILQGDVIVMDIYGITGECIPWKKVNVGGGAGNVMVGTYYVIMKYYMIELIESRGKSADIMQKMLKMKEASKHMKISDLLEVQCMGVQDDLVREFKLKKFFGIDPKTGKPVRLVKYI